MIHDSVDWLIASCVSAQCAIAEISTAAALPWDLNQGCIILNDQPLMPQGLSPLSLSSNSSIFTTQQLAFKRKHSKRTSPNIQGHKKLVFMSCLPMSHWPRQVKWSSTQLTWERATEGHEEEVKNMGFKGKLLESQLCVLMGNIFTFYKPVFSFYF